MKKAYALIIFDVDGTLVTTKSGQRFRKTADDWQWLPGRLEKLATLRNQGIKLALATNQGGVAFGYLDPHAMRQELYTLARSIHAIGIEICFSHPQASIDLWREDSPRRKPGPEMLLTIIKRCGVSRDETLIIGDRPEDEQAAKNAGCDFMQAINFFLPEDADADFTSQSQ